MTATDIAEWVSIPLTVWLIYRCALVVRTFWSRTERTLALLWQGETPSQKSMLILGIVLSFVAAILDNSYWNAAWSAAAIDHPARDWLFANGVWSNLPFRISLGIAAAECHLYAAKRD